MAGPPAPTITSSVSNGTSIVVNWSASLGATSYSVTLTGSDGTQTFTVPSTILTYTFTGFTSGVAHTTTVAAINGFGSNETTVTVDDISVGMTLWTDTNDTTKFSYGNNITLNTTSYQSISGVRDKSGLNHNLISTIGATTSPLYIPSYSYSVTSNLNTNNYVRFRTDESPWFTDFSNNVAGNITPCVVFNGHPSGQYASLNTNINTVNTPFSFFIVFADVNYGAFIGSTDSINFYVNYNDTYGDNSITNGTINILTTLNQKKKYNYGVVIKSLVQDTNDLPFYNQELNGEKISTRIFPSNSGVISLNNIRLNGRTNGEETDCFLFEFIIYNRSLTQNETNMATGYLATKWGLQSQLPPDHPYYSQPYTGSVITLGGSSASTRLAPSQTATNAINYLFDTSANSLMLTYCGANGNINGLITFRSLIKPLQDAQKGFGKINIIKVINNGSALIIPITNQTDVENYIYTMDTINIDRPPDISKPIYSVLPVYSGVSSPYTASFDLITSYNGKLWANIITDSDATVVFELPISITGSEYHLTLIYGADTITVKYNGTNLINVDTLVEYNASSTLQIGTFPLPLVSLGSFGGYGGGGGGGGGGETEFIAPTVTATAGDTTITVNWLSVPDGYLTADAYIVIYTDTNTQQSTTVNVPRAGADPGTGDYPYSILITSLINGHVYNITVAAHSTVPIEETGPTGSVNGVIPTGSGGGGGGGGEGGGGALGGGAITSTLPRPANPHSFIQGTLDYTDFKNTVYGFVNSRGQFIFNQSLGISGEYISPASLPNFPVRQGGNASQIHTNTQNRTLFNALNAQSIQVQNGQRSWTPPVFKSHQDLLKYIQAQYTQAIPGTPQSGTNYNVTTLFPPNL